MSIHKTKFGCYRVRWRDRGRLRSKNFDRKIDAEKFEAQTKLGEVLPVSEKLAEKNEFGINFSTMAEIWLTTHAEVHKSPSSVIRDRQMLRDYLLPTLGRLSLTSISKRDIVLLQAKLKSTTVLSAKTINNTLGLLHKIFEDAVRWDYLPANPAAKIQRIKLPEQDYRFWTIEERERFLNFARSRKPWLAEIVAFAAHTGMRSGEIEGLRRDCLNFERREIIVKRSFCHKSSSLKEYTKGKAIRRVPMNQVVYSILKERMLLPPTAQVFAGVNFEHLLFKHFKPMQHLAGVNVIRFHDLRHTFASQMVMGGANLFEVQKILGHADIKMTQRYAHLAPDHLRGKTDILLVPALTSTAIQSTTANDTPTSLYMTK